MLFVLFRVVAMCVVSFCVLVCFVFLHFSCVLYFCFSDDGCWYIVFFSGFICLSVLRFVLCFRIALSCACVVFFVFVSLYSFMDRLIFFFSISVVLLIVLPLFDFALFLFVCV